MSRLRQALLERYQEHYARVNISTLPAAHAALEYEAQLRPLLAGLPPGSRVLDVGCGTGLLLRWLAQFPHILPVGVDASAGQIALARTHLPATVSLHCEEGVGFLASHPGSFAAVFCFDLLEHLPSEEELLTCVERSRQALQPGGFFCCRVPNMANLFGAYSRYMDLTHARGFTSTSLLQLLETAGLSRCRIVPRKPTGLLQGLRMACEYWLHRILFRVCGRSLERHFASNLIGLAYKE